MDIEINRNKKNYRLWELLPGGLTWLAFLLPIVFSIFWPFLTASLIIIFAIIWLVRAIMMSIRLIIAYKNFKKNVVIDWYKKCRDEFPQKYKSIYHMAILATYKEDIETIRYSLKALADSNYNPKKIIFILATEERDKENAQEIAKKLKNEFKDTFYYFGVTVHPMNVPGEVKGKGSNITYSAKEALKFIQKNNIPVEDVMVTTLDADNRVHKEYFACVTYNFLKDPDPVHKSFQPISMYFNNIWRVPFFIRSISVGGSFWQMIESTRPYRMRNFSAHAQSLEALIKTNFWSTRTIVEDGHQYWRSYFTFNGNYEVVPIPIPIYQDAVLSKRGYKATFVEQYIQKRRWAWGCSDIPYVLTNVIGNSKLPFIDKWLQTFRLIEGHFSWSTTSIILSVVGWMPILLNHGFRATVMAYNFPVIYSRILTVALSGLAVTLVLSSFLLPPPPKKSLTWSVVFEWIVSPFMLPVSNVVFGSIAATDAQTRLFLGKYLGFKVTEKAPYYDDYTQITRSR